MRARLASLLLAASILTGTSSFAMAASKVTVYDPDPNHLWNRLYQALAVRTLGGVEYGVDNADPYPDPFDNGTQVGKLLDEFLSKHGESLSSNATARALLLNDVWTAFDMSVRGNWSPALTTRLALVLSRLRLTPAEISALPDNYELAIESGKFASDFDPEHPETPFLPPDLFDPAGPWVQIANREHAPTAQMHVQTYSGRSLFLVFIRCPGGREATLSYLNRLNSYPTPLIPTASMPGIISFSRDPRSAAPLSFDPKTPQFPEGTAVALVRRLMVIDQNLNPTFTPITQRVQFRVYKNLKTQSVYELVMRRQSLTATPDSSLHATSPTEQEYQAAVVGHERGTAGYFEGPVVMRTCATCHGANGIVSLNTYTGFYDEEHTNPHLLPVDVDTGQSRLTIQWKQSRFEWGVLHGIWTANQAY